MEIPGSDAVPGGVILNIARVGQHLYWGYGDNSWQVNLKSVKEE